MVSWKFSVHVELFLTHKLINWLEFCIEHNCFYFFNINFLEFSVLQFIFFWLACGCAAIVSGGKGTAQGKIQTLREAGVTVVESPAKIGSAMFDVFKQRGLVN